MTISSTTTVPYFETPLVYSSDISRQAPCKIFLKQEFIQPSGSYKIRGLSHHVKKELEIISQTSPNKEVIVVAASGGNAGNAVSYSSKFFNLKSIIVVPISTSLNMRRKIEANGSQVLVKGSSIGEADEYVKNQVIPNLREDQVAIYCHPYDLPNIWEGHSSLIDEITSQLTEQGQMSKLKGIVCSIGGGGLYNGLIHGLTKHKLFDIPVMTIETDSCPTFQDGIDANVPVKQKSFNTIAVSLACPYISPKSLENYHIHKTRNVHVTDSDAAEACIKFATDSNIIVEPACGVALCCVYKDLLSKNASFFNGLEEDDIVVVIVCGGSSTTIDDLSNYKQLYQLK